MSLAGAVRTTGVSRRVGSIGRDRPGRPVSHRSLRRPRLSERIGPSASRSASHSPTASVCGRRSGSMPPWPEGGRHAARLDRELSARARCGSSCAARGTPAWTSRHNSSSVSASSRSSASNGSTTMTADSTAGSGSNAPAGTSKAIRTLRVVLHEDGQVAHLAGRRSDPFGDLALDHQDGSFRARGARPSSAWRIGLVMWYGQVRDHVVRRLHQPDQVLVERIALDQAQRARFERGHRTARAGTPRGRDRARRR